MSICRMRVFCSLTVGALLFGAVVAASAANSKEIAKKSLVVFNVSTSSVTASSKPEIISQCASDLSELLNDGLSGNKSFSVVKFEPRLPGIQRGIKEQRFTEKETLGEIDTTPIGVARARKFANVMGSDIAVIGSVDKYAYDASKGSVEVTVSIEMVDVATGKVTDMFMATGRGTQSGQSEQAAATAGIYDVSEKLMTDINKMNPVELVANDEESAGSVQQTAPAATHKKNKGLVPAMLGAALLGFLLSGG